MKKCLSRWSFYLFAVGMFARMIWRFLKIGFVIYFKSFWETKFNFMLVNAVFFQTSKSIFANGKVNHDYLPVMTESLHLCLKVMDCDPPPYEFASEFSKKLSSIALTDEVMDGKLIDMLQAMFLTQAVDVMVPYSEHRSPNEVCFALLLDLSIDDGYWDRHDVVERVIASRLKLKDTIDCHAYPSVAKQLIEAGFQKGSGWAMPKTIGAELCQLMFDHGQIPYGIEQLANDDALSLWAAGVSDSIARETRLGMPEIARIVQAALSFARPVSRVLHSRHIEWFSRSTLPDHLVQDEPDAEEPIEIKEQLWPKNWSKKQASYQSATLIKMVESGNPSLKKEALDICRSRSSINLLHMAECGADEDLTLLAIRKDWRFTRREFFSKHPGILPALIKENIKFIRYFHGDIIKTEVLIKEMSQLDEIDFIPKKIMRADAPKLMKIAVLKSCPYAIFKLSKMDEKTLLDHAKTYPDFELIFNYCENKHPDNLSRYPGKLRDKQFGADLGL